MEALLCLEPTITDTCIVFENKDGYVKLYIDNIIFAIELHGKKDGFTAPDTFKLTNYREVIEKWISKPFHIKQALVFLSSARGKVKSGNDFALYLFKILGKDYEAALVTSYYSVERDKLNIYPEIGIVAMEKYRAYMLQYFPNATIIIAATNSTVPYEHINEYPTRELIYSVMTRSKAKSARF